MTEDSLLAAVTDAATRRGLLWHHCPDARRCDGGRGFPDLVIAGEKGIVLAELKAEDGDTSAQQDMWIWTLHQAGVPWAVWRPRDWHSGAITAALDKLKAGA